MNDNQFQLTPDQIKFRESLRALKSDIKQLSAQQRDLKRQRKTVHFTGERTVDAGKAASMVRKNGYDLMHMFILYGDVRKKPCGYEDHANSLLLQVMRDKYFPDYSEEPTAFSDVREVA